MTAWNELPAYERALLERALTAMDVCELLGIKLPDRRRPDYGSSMAGGSQLETRAQEGWDRQVQALNRKGSTS